MPSLPLSCSPPPPPSLGAQPCFPAMPLNIYMFLNPLQVRCTYTGGVQQPGKCSAGALHGWCAAGTKCRKNYAAPFCAVLGHSAIAPQYQGGASVCCYADVLPYFLLTYLLTYLLCDCVVGHAAVLGAAPPPRTPVSGCFPHTASGGVVPVWPTEPRPTEDDSSYRARNSRSSGLRVEKVHFVAAPDGSLNRHEVQFQTASPMVMLGPVTSDSPMRARTAQRGWTASTFGAMCCMLQVGRSTASSTALTFNVSISLHVCGDLYACMHVIFMDCKSHCTNAVSTCIADCPSRTCPTLRGLPRR